MKVIPTLLITLALIISSCEKADTKQGTVELHTLTATPQDTIAPCSVEIVTTLTAQGGQIIMTMKHPGAFQDAEHLIPKEQSIFTIIADDIGNKASNTLTLYYQDGGTYTVSIDHEGQSLSDSFTLQ